MNVAEGIAFNLDGTSLDLTTSYFMNFRGAARGGAIFATKDHSLNKAVTLKLTSTKFFNMQAATHGGAFYSENVDVIMATSEFSYGTSGFS